MNELKSQQERRRWLIRALLEEMPQYQYPVFPYTQERQRRLLRSLMNVRPPLPVSEEFLQIQDACLNYGESYCPRQIADQAVCLDGDIGETLQKLL